MPDGLINGCEFCGGLIGKFDVLAAKQKTAAGAGPCTRCAYV